jgi:hypothetical protein
MIGNGGQQTLFHDSIDDALGTCVAFCGGPKKVGGWLYPSLTPSAAEARVRANLNPERDHKFSPGEIEVLGLRARELGCFALQEYLAGKWACEFKPLAPAEAKKRAKRVRRLALLEELKRLEDEE